MSKTYRRRNKELRVERRKRGDKDREGGRKGDTTWFREQAQRQGIRSRKHRETKRAAKERETETERQRDRVKESMTMRERERQSEGEYERESGWQGET